MQSKTQTPQGEVSHVVTFSQENGQTVTQVVSTLGSARHDFKITVGSLDGTDAISELSQEDLQASLQDSLDSARTNAAGILSNRARVSQLVKSLK